MYQELRFVLVVQEGRYSVLIITDLSLTAKDIIGLYSKIECMFQKMMQINHTFGYRF
ncbi:hypothetical protein NYE24_11455 [Paenibacillus sp. FSL H7-0350]|uniref:hypothetical protein n=1 Tax=Paenibacillus sp. FSL H7-0350 TaxID=2975345 RepID=UPI00315862DE